MANPTTEYESVNIFGINYLFGTVGFVAPADLTNLGFKANSFDIKAESPVFVEGMDGEGMTDSIVVTKGERSKLTMTMTGYITDIDQFNNAAGNAFPISGGDLDGRVFIITSTSIPRKSGQLVEATVECVSNFLIDSATPVAS